MVLMILCSLPFFLINSAGLSISQHEQTRKFLCLLPKEKGNLENLIVVKKLQAACLIPTSFSIEGMKQPSYKCSSLTLLSLSYLTATDIVVFFVDLPPPTSPTSFFSPLNFRISSRPRKIDPSITTGKKEKSYR